MKDLVLVSLVLITYNQREYIFEALDSVFCQTYPKIELIVSDDGSEDFSVEEIADYIEKNKKENIIGYKVNKNPQNIGTVKNLNKAIKMSTGKYICVLAGDDVLYDENVIEDYVRFACQNDVLVIAGTAAVYSEDLEHYLSRVPSDILYKKTSDMNPFDLYCICAQGINVLPGCAAVYARKVFDVSGYFDEEYVLLEDAPFALRFLREGNKMYFYDRPYVKHRYGGVTDLNHKKHSVFIKDVCLMYKKEILPYEQLLGKEIIRKAEFNLAILESEELKERLNVLLRYREFAFEYLILRAKILTSHYLQKIGLYDFLRWLIALRRKIIGRAVS